MEERDIIDHCGFPFNIAFSNGCRSFHHSCLSIRAHHTLAAIPCWNFLAMACWGLLRERRWMSRLSVTPYCSYLVSLQNYMFHWQTLSHGSTDICWSCLILGADIWWSCLILGKGIYWSCPILGTDICWSCLIRGSDICWNCLILWTDICWNCLIFATDICQSCWILGFPNPTTTVWPFGKRSR
jgi:hypothetical protein